MNIQDQVQELQAEDRRLKQKLSDLQIILDEQVAYSALMREAYKLAEEASEEPCLCDHNELGCLYCNKWIKAQNLYNENPSPELLNTLKADAVRGFARRYVLCKPNLWVHHAEEYADKLEGGD